MARVTPDQATAKWLSRLQAATTEIQNGVARVTTAPGTLAAAKSQKWLNNVTAAQTKWARNVASVSLTDWQAAMNNYGIARVAQGAQAKQQKVTNFFTSFLPFLDRGVAQIKAMDDTTFEARLQRAVAMMRYNATYVRPS